MADRNGLVVAVTGGASGLGAAVVRLLEYRGDRPVAIDRLPASEVVLQLVRLRHVR